MAGRAVELPEQPQDSAGAILIHGTITAARRLLKEASVAAGLVGDQRASEQLVIPPNLEAPQEGVALLQPQQPI